MKFYVGRFNDYDIDHKKDKSEVEKAMKENPNLKYVDTKLVLKSKKVVAIDIWIQDTFCL